MLHRITTVVVASFLLHSAALAQSTIERIAPENSILIVGSKNVETLKNHFQQTALWTLWQTDQAQKLRADFMKQMAEGIDKTFEELGVEKDTLVLPAGAVGFALFTTPNAQQGAAPMIGFLTTVDYGNEVSAMATDSFIQAALARGEKDDHLEFEHKDVSGRMVYTIDLSKMHAQEDDDEDMDEMEDIGDMPIPMPSPQDMMKGLEQVHYVRDKNVLLVSSDLQTLNDAIDIADGKGAAAKHVADRPEFQAVMNKLGDSDFYGVLLTRDVLELFAASDPMGMSQMMRPALRALVGEVQGYGFACRFDGPNAMIEQTLTAYMPKGKEGLTALMDVPAQRTNLPSFVGPETVSYFNFSFRFSGIMDVIRKVVASTPILAAQVGPELEEISTAVNQVTNALGAQVHWSVSATRPFTPESRQTTLAIECVKPQDIENLLAPFAAESGIEARDFLGQRIYTLPEGAAEMMMPFPGMEMDSVSLGLGGGFIFIGSTPVVEQSLRATGGASTPAAAATLSSNPEFQRASSSLSKDGLVAWGFSNTIDSMEATLAVQRKAMEQAIEAMADDAPWAGEEDGDALQDDEEINALQNQAKEQLRESMKLWDQIDFNLLRKHIGPSAWQLKSIEDGLTFHSYILDASSQK